MVQAISERHRIAPENVLLGNGTVELIYAIPAALNVRRGLIIGPTFSEYERALELSNCPCDVRAGASGRYIIVRPFRKCWKG